MLWVTSLLWSQDLFWNSCLLQFIIFTDCAASKQCNAISSLGENEVVVPFSSSLTTRNNTWQCRHYSSLHYEPCISSYLGKQQGRLADHRATPPFNSALVIGPTPVLANQCGNMVSAAFILDQPPHRVLICYHVDVFRNYGSVLCTWPQKVQISPVLLKLPISGGNKVEVFTTPLI